MGFQPAARLPFAENRFAQVIDVHAQAGRAPFRQVAREHFLFRREDDIGRLVVHAILDQWHGHARQVAAERLESLEQSPVERTEKPRDPLDVQDVDELVHGALRRLRAEGLVGHLREGGLVLGIL